MDALAPFHTFSVESQILHHAPVKIVPAERRVGAAQAWSVTRAQAGLFVNTEQWTLGKHFPRVPQRRAYVPQILEARIIPCYGSCYSFRERTDGLWYWKTQSRIHKVSLQHNSAGSR